MPNRFETGLRTRRNTALSVVAGVIVAGGVLFSASAGYAQSGFSMKVAPPNCTETDFTGGTSKSGDTATGFSARNNMFCSLGFPTLSVRLTMNGVTGPTQSTRGGEFATQVSTKMVGAGVPTGLHKIGTTARTT